jgi:hypothetical protein
MTTSSKTRKKELLDEQCNESQTIPKEDVQLEAGSSVV